MIVLLSQGCLQTCLTRGGVVCSLGSRNDSLILESEIKELGIKGFQELQALVVVSLVENRQELVLDDQTLLVAVAVADGPSVQQVSVGLFQLEARVVQEMAQPDVLLQL